MSCKARQAMNNECVAWLLAQCPPSWAGAVEQKLMCYNITKSLGTGKVVRRKIRSTKKSMVHSACSWWWTPWVLIENEEFPEPARKHSQIISSKLQPEAALRNLQVLGCKKPGRLWGNLATRATMIFRKILYRHGSRWASAIEDHPHETGTKFPNFASSLVTYRPGAWPPSNLQNQHLWQEGHLI